MEELEELRKFKKDVEDSCSYNVVIQNMNDELDIVRKKLTSEINKYKNITLEYEHHINHLYESISFTIISKIDEDFNNFGITEFNLIDVINIYVGAFDICEFLRMKLKHLFIKHNSENDIYFFYYLKSNPNEWIILEDSPNIDYFNLVCPEYDAYYTECNCKCCSYIKKDISEEIDY